MHFRALQLKLNHACALTGRSQIKGAETRLKYTIQDRDTTQNKVLSKNDTDISNFKRQLQRFEVSKRVKGSSSYPHNRCQEWCRYPAGALDSGQEWCRRPGQVSGVVQVPRRRIGQRPGVVQVPRRCPGQVSGVVQKLAY